MATPITDPNAQPPKSGDENANNKEFEQVYEKVNVDEIDTSGLEVATTMDATNAALLKQVEQVPLVAPDMPAKKSDMPAKKSDIPVKKSDIPVKKEAPKSNAIPEIPDIAAYIAATKEATKEKEKMPTQYLAMDGTDLAKVPGVFAIVPNQKWDHKIVFLRKDAPAELINDPKNRIKWSVYQKDGEDIYKVSVDMKQHTTLRNTEGKPLDVRVIDDPKDLDNQIQSIYDGKWGGTNFGMPVKITKGSWPGKSTPTAPQKEVKVEAKKISPAIEKVSTEKKPTKDMKDAELLPKEDIKPVKIEVPITEPINDSAVVKDKPATEGTLQEIKKQVTIIEKGIEPDKVVQKSQPKQTDQEVQNSMDDAWKAMKEKMNPAVSEVAVPTTNTASVVPIREPIAPSIPPELPVKSVAPVSAPVETTVTTKVPKPTPNPKTPPENSKPAKKDLTDVNEKAPIPPVKLETPKKKEPIENASALEQPKKSPADKIVAPMPAPASIEKKLPEIDIVNPDIAEVIPPPSPFPVFNIDTTSTAVPAPRTTPKVPVGNLVNEKSLDVELSKAPTENQPKTIEQMLEQEAKPELQQLLSTNNPSRASITNAPNNTVPKTHKPMLPLSKKQRIGILIVLGLAIARILWVMFWTTWNTDSTDQPTTTGEVNNFTWEANPNDVVKPNDNKPTPTPDDTTKPDEVVPAPTDEPVKWTDMKFTMAELVAKLEELQVESRKTLNEARKVGNPEAIKFSVASLQKATSALDNIEQDTTFTADQAQKDATRAEKYLQDATKLLEGNKS